MIVVLTAKFWGNFYTAVDKLNINRASRSPYLLLHKNFPKTN